MEAALLDRLTYLIQFYVYAEAEPKDVQGIIDSLAERDSYDPGGDGWVIVKQDEYDTLTTRPTADLGEDGELVEELGVAIRELTGVSTAKKNEVESLTGLSFNAIADYTRRAADRIKQLKAALAPFVNGSIDVSGAAVIVGYPECEPAWRAARAAYGSSADQLGDGWRLIATLDVAKLQEGEEMMVANDRGVFVGAWEPEWSTEHGFHGGWWLVSDGKDEERALRGNTPTYWRPVPRLPRKGE